MATKAQKEAVKRYDDKMDRVNCRLPEGTKKRIEKIGYKSINAFITSAVLEKLEHDEKYLK